MMYYEYPQPYEPQYEPLLAKSAEAWLDQVESTEDDTPTMELVTITLSGITELEKLNKLLANWAYQTGISTEDGVIDVCEAEEANEREMEALAQKVEATIKLLIVSINEHEGVFMALEPF